jgi:hypothetical protein
LALFVTAQLLLAGRRSPARTSMAGGATNGAISWRAGGNGSACDSPSPSTTGGVRFDQQGQ